MKRQVSLSNFMKNDNLAPLLLTGGLIFIVASYAFLIYTNIILIIFNIIIALLYGVFILLRELQFRRRTKKLMMMANFIEIVILNINVQKTIDGALNAVHNLLPEQLQKKIATFTTTDGTVVIFELAPYFAHQYYDVFIELLTTYEERGGDIIKMSEVLLHRIDGARGTMNALLQIDTRYIVKFMSNWLFILTVSTVFRYSLSAIYAQVKENIYFIIGNQLLILVMLTSLFFVNENKIKRSLDVS